MKRGIYIFVVISLLIALMGTIGCTEGKGGAEENSPETESFSTIVEMNGKELTLGTPTITYAEQLYAIIAVVVENSGDKPITVAEFEMVPYGSSEFDRPPVVKDSTITVKDLYPSEVRILYWRLQGIGSGSCKVEVKKLE